MNILLGITGSVAAIHTNRLVHDLRTIGDVKVILTESARDFPNVGPIHCDTYTDSSERWQHIGDSILHIDLRNWADVFVIAPLSANSLSKMVSGQCDNLLTSVVRAWDYGKPIIVCPSMNTNMWENDPTATQIAELAQRGFQIISPVVKTLACGDFGMGAMCSRDDILDVVCREWANPLGRDFFLPTGDHPGAFGAIRKYDIHTGIDIYCNDGDPVYAMEDGNIIGWLPFTGPEVGFDFWESTACVMVAGQSGVINYGEVQSIHRANPFAPVKRGEQIASVKRVLKLGKERPDITHHSLSMLHIELYRRGTTKPVIWNLNMPKPRELLNPTSRLKQIQ